MANAVPDAARTPNSMAGAGMGLAAGMNMGQQMASAMGGQGQPGGYGQPQMGVGPGGAPAAGAYQAAPAQPAPAQAAPSAGSGGSASMVERLKKLDALRAAGVLSEEEYASKRAEILAEI
jgi:hypothetical protein